MTKSHTALRVTALVFGLLISQAFSRPQESSTAESRQESAIEHLGPPEFNAENNAVITISPVEKGLAAEMTPIVNAISDTKDSDKNKQAEQGLDAVIQKYPQYSDAYFLRATLSILGGDQNFTAVLRDIDTAIKLHSADKFSSAYDSTAPMYSLRAKVDLLASDYTRAMRDLQTAITIDPSDLTDVFDSGGVKPEENTNPAALEKPDVDSLVARYPKNYRSFLFRGLFYLSFTTYSEQYYAPALRDLEEARELNPTSSMVNYFLGVFYQKRAFWTKAAWSDISQSGGYKDKTHAIALRYFDSAVKLDPKFAEAYAEVAETLFELKRYKDAIPIYGKVLELDPGRSGAYNDRGLAKTYVGDYYGAIEDFSQAINLEKQGDRSSLENAYENRADAYVKTGDFVAATEDYGRAIGLKFASQVFLMSVAQIRSIYPEFAEISNQDLLEGLREKYYPNMSPADFLGQYRKNTKPFEDFVLAGLYENRGDSYLYAGKCKKATEDYGRALHDDSTYTLDRWKTILKTTNKEYSVDAQTLDCGQTNTASLWLKISTSTTGTNDQIDYQIDCSGRTIRVVTVLHYNSLGTPIGEGGEEDWEVISPESLGEKLYDTACGTLSNQ